MAPIYAVPTGENAGGQAASAMQSAASGYGLNVASLPLIAQIQICVANVLGQGGSQIIPGNLEVDGVVGIGVAPTTNRALRVNSTVTASGTEARAISIGATMVAAANNDALTNLYIAPSYTPGAFTGVQVKGVSIPAFTVATFTTPADPIAIDLGIITGTGATNAFGIRIAPPTGATNNYLISHTTPATFNVTDAGGLRAARTGIGKAVTATSVLCITGLPTSSAGLASGDVWANSNVLTIIP